MAIICWTAMEQLANCCVAFAGISKDCRILSAFAFIFLQFWHTPLVRPINIFSATERFGQRVISWYTVLIPSLCASCGEWIATALSFPFKKISPSSFPYTPVNTLINVDFPAPFSPISAWISPSHSVKSTPCKARTPGKLLWIFFISNTAFSFTSAFTP